MAQAGFKCVIKYGGFTTNTTNEPMTLISGTQYQVTALAKRALDPEVSWNLKDSVGTLPFTSITSAVFSNGTFYVTGATGAVTFTGAYLPLSSNEISTAVKDFSISENIDMLETTVFNDGTSNAKRNVAGLQDVTVSLSGPYSLSDVGRLNTLQFNNKMCLLDIVYANSNTFRAYGRINSIEVSAAVDGLVETSINWQISAEKHDASGIFIGPFDGVA